MTFQRDQQVYGVSVGTTSTNATYIATRDPNVNDMNELGLRSGSKFRKSAAVVGEVLAKYLR